MKANGITRELAVSHSDSRSPNGMNPIHQGEQMGMKETTTMKKMYTNEY
jgi:hypothetical protein